MFKIPSGVVKDFLQAEAEMKPTNDPNEVRIKSIYENDSKFKCYINTEKFQFCDFKSGTAGSCYTLFRDMLDMDSNKAVLRYIMKNYGAGQFTQFEEVSDVPQNSSNIIEEFNEVDKPIYFTQVDKVDKYGRSCIKYLIDRKIGVPYIKRMGFVHNPDSKFNKRIIIPYTEDGKMVYFQGRTTDKSNPLRYLNPAGLGKQDYVFNYDNLNDDELIIVEGVFDAISVDPNEQTATCMGGAFIMPKQLQKIFNKAKPKTIIYVPDQDETGFAKMHDNIKRIYTYADYSPNILIFNPPAGCKDLNDMLVNTGKNFILKKDCEKYKGERKHLWEK